MKEIKYDKESDVEMEREMENIWSEAEKEIN